MDNQFAANFPLKGSPYWNGFILGQVATIMLYCAARGFFDLLDAIQ